MRVNHPEGSFIYYVRDFFRKTNNSYPLIRTCTCAVQVVRNVSVSETFADVLNEWSLNWIESQVVFKVHDIQILNTPIISGLFSLLSFSEILIHQCLVVTKGHTYSNKHAAKSCSFVYLALGFKGWTCLKSLNPSTSKIYCSKFFSHHCITP